MDMIVCSRQQNHMNTMQSLTELGSAVVGIEVGCAVGLDEGSEVGVLVVTTEHSAARL